MSNSSHIRPATPAASCKRESFHSEMHVIYGEDLPYDGLSGTQDRKGASAKGGSKSH